MTASVLNCGATQHYSVIYLIVTCTDVGAATMGMDRHILITSNKILHWIWLWRDFLWQEWN